MGKSEDIKKQIEDLKKKQQELEEEEQEEIEEETDEEDPKMPEPPKNQVKYTAKDIIFELRQISRKIRDYEDQIKTRPLSSEVSKEDLANRAETLNIYLMQRANILLKQFNYKQEEITRIIREAGESKVFYGYKFIHYDK